MIRGKLITASVLSEEEIRKIEEYFSCRLGSEVSLDVVVNDGLIGGFSVEIGGKVFSVYDNSYIGVLHDIKKSLNTVSLKGLLDENTDADKISEKEISALKNVLISRINDYSGPTREYNIGRVTDVADGIAHISGISGCKYGSLIDFKCGAQAIVLDITEERVGAILLNGADDVYQGMSCIDKGNILCVPVGEELIGRVLDAMGHPIDGKGSLDYVNMGTRPIEAEAPAIGDRQGVNTPLETGILCIDSMIPIGKGQRELIIGDRQTGKTAIAIDTILNQRDKDVICVYCAIGQKASSIAETVDILESMNAMDYTCVVAATASDSAAMQYIAPYAACAIAEEFMYAGKDVLVVYDDLSKHAVAYRTLSLLLRRPPGREAYPGDVFYLHSRLLERAAKLSDRLGGGSMTALPIVETMAGDISAYIPTNVISITDGQIFLETDLFNAGHRPAINAGLSVSRVGGSAQIRAMRKASGTLRLELAQYRELEVFSQFASDLDKSTQDQLKKGERVNESLVQKQFSPLEAAEQVIILNMISGDALLKVPTERVSEFNDGFISYVKMKRADIVEQINTKGELNERDTADIVAISEEYVEIFLGEGEHEE